MLTDELPESKFQEDLDKIMIEEGNNEKYFLFGNSLNPKEKL